jgi:hypothetical protein
MQEYKFQCFQLRQLQYTRLIGFPVVQAGKFDGKVETGNPLLKAKLYSAWFLHLDEFPGSNGNPSSI